MNQSHQNEHLDADDLVVDATLQSLAGKTVLPDVSSFITKDVDRMMEARATQSFRQLRTSAASQKVRPEKFTRNRFSKSEKKVRGWRTIRVTALATIAVLTFSSLAYAGLLPAPVQKTVAKVAKRAGISVPMSRSDATDDRLTPRQPDGRETPADKEYGESTTSGSNKAKKQRKRGNRRSNGNNSRVAKPKGSTGRSTNSGNGRSQSTKPQSGGMGNKSSGGKKATGSAKKPAKEVGKGGKSN